MKTTVFRHISKVTIIFLAALLNQPSLWANSPDSTYVFAYATTKNQSKNGLHFAWSVDQKNWVGIGPEYSFLTCDYGTWGGEKRMYTPFLFQDNTGLFHAVWSVNNRDNTYAEATSKDLILWKPQIYPEIPPHTNCIEPIITHSDNTYSISWYSSKDSSFYSNDTKDFVHYTTAYKITEDAYNNSRQHVIINGKEEIGTILKVKWDIIQNLEKTQQAETYNNQKNREGYRLDNEKFGKIEDLHVDITADLNNAKAISDLLIGVFFEDINYAADGGLYAELVQNRGFEYNIQDKKGRDQFWTATKAWKVSDEKGMSLTIDTIAPIHINNQHFAIIKTKQIGTALINEGYDGFNLKKGEQYDFSAFVKCLDSNSTKLLIQVINQEGKVGAKGTISCRSSQWKKAKATLKAVQDITNGQLEIIPQSNSALALDMISLFPQNTFMGHPNGLRKDLAQAIADLHPRFVRFPGGCVAHGDGIDNIYHWKNTIGPLESRKPQRNLWGYHQSYGLGYFEYFQFCEDLGAEPVPVIAAAVPCQNSSCGGAGQQGGIPMDEMDNYVQDILDLIEYCNGDKATTWGKKRAEAGHPKPFNLKYIGIGNEDLISVVFKERFEYIYNIIKEKHPEITIIGTVGPFYKGSDYEEGWDFASQLNVPMVDEHYYEQPGWFINNQHFYDRYDRNEPQVYLGEYASWNNELFNALAEAIYLTGIERNGDIVTMSSYAPLLAKEHHTQWNTDLIFFNNNEIKLTPNYEVQKLYGQNSGNTYIYSNAVISDANPDVQNRIGESIIQDSKTGDIIIKIVNILPVRTEANLSLTGLTGYKATASKTTLCGHPKDREVKPTIDSITIGEQTSIQLSPYSFTVIRLKKDN